MDDPAKQSEGGSSEAADGVESLSLEAALEQLEATARRLEQGDLPLEEALALFETGVALTRQCTDTLEAAERRIEILVADREATGGFRTDPFEADIDEGGADGDEEGEGFDEV
jgi:exodeoxyribonuclease VII small subunit